MADNKKIEHDPKALKDTRTLRLDQNGKAMTQVQVADKAQAILEQSDCPSVPKTFSQRQLADIESGKANLGFARGLALAQVYDVCLSTFIKDDILKLGPLQTRVREFPDPIERENYLLGLEKDGRVVVFSSFPSVIFLDVPSHNESHLPQEIRLQRERWKQLKSVDADTKEFYTIDSVLEFAFSPFSRFPLPERAKVLEHVISLFDGNHHNLYFFHEPAYPRTIANLRFSRAKKMIYLDLPNFSGNFLEIWDVLVYEKLLKFYKATNSVIKTEQSLDLLERIRKILRAKPAPVKDQVRLLYEQSSPELQDVMWDSVKILLGQEAAGNPDNELASHQAQAVIARRT